MARKIVTHTFVQCDMCGYDVTSDGRAKDFAHRVKLMAPFTSDKNPSHDIEICYSCFEKMEERVKSIMKRCGDKNGNNMLKNRAVIPQNILDRRNKMREKRESTRTIMNVDPITGDAVEIEVPNTETETEEITFVEDEDEQDRDFTGRD